MMVIWCLIAWVTLSGILLYALCKASAIADEAARRLRGIDEALQRKEAEDDLCSR